jgi:hypothetical protein
MSPFDKLRVTPPLDVQYNLSWLAKAKNLLEQKGLLYICPTFISNVEDSSLPFRMTKNFYNNSNLYNLFNIN